MGNNSRIAEQLEHSEHASSDLGDLEKRKNDRRTKSRLSTEQGSRRAIAF